MKIEFVDQLSKEADCLIIAAKQGLWDKELEGLPGRDFVLSVLEESSFDGKLGQAVPIYIPHKDGHSRLLFVGTGDGRAQDCEIAGGRAIAAIVGASVQSAALQSKNVETEGLTHLAYGIRQRQWAYNKYKSKNDKNKRGASRFEKLSILMDTANAAEHQILLDRLMAIGDGIELTRELVTEPANIIYPETFVERCRPMEELGVEFTILNEEEMRGLGMGALLGVAQGSARAPRLLAMRWDGTNGAMERPLVIVGKGVTFDTGGISLKPAAGMEAMKWDMGGAGATAGIMRALAGRQANVHVVCVCGLVENMPDAAAQRPGDVVTSMNGQTIEVINTDAEGRLVLCDAMHWAQEKYNPEYMIDLATLTGAMIIALGHEHGGCFSNDDELAGWLTDAGLSTGDKLWRLPLHEEYDKLINSPIADIKNVGPRGGGSITAAQFLQRFVKDGVKWAHLDIAGMVWADKPGSTWGKGATGFGVRLLDRLVSEQFENS